MFDIFNKKKLKAYRLITDIQSNLIDKLIVELEKQLKKREKAETISAHQVDIIRKNVSKRAKLNNEISVLQIDLEEANKKIDALAEEKEEAKKEITFLKNGICELQDCIKTSDKKIFVLRDENEKLKEELKKFDEEHYCVTFCKRNNAVDEVSNVAKCSD